MSKTPTGIYVRMSKDRTGAGLGVARQEKECRELADRLGLDVVSVYSDNDASAYKSTKPRNGYASLLADIEAGRIKAVVCWHLDRLTRRTAELETYLSVTEKISTYTVSGGSFDLTTPSGRATAKTVGAWAQAEVEQKALRQQAKNRQLAESGQRMPGGPVPFGYADDKRTPHKVYGEMVRKAYRDILENRKGVNGIAADWQAAGAPVPQSVSGRWDRGSVKRVLMRESNAGLVVHQGKVLAGVVGDWEPLVSVADFYAVRGILSDPARRMSPGNKPVHLLSGIVECASCGHKMRRQKIGGPRGSVYACSNRKSLRGDCPAPVMVDYDKLTTWFEDKFLTECGDRPGIVVGLPDAEKSAEGERAATVAELDGRVRSIALQMADPDADMGSLSAALAEAKAERAAAEGAPLAIPTTALTIAQSWDADPSGDGDAQLHYRRSMIKAQVQTFQVHPVGRGKRTPVEDRVTVAWV